MPTRREMFATNSDLDTREHCCHTRLSKQNVLSMYVLDTRRVFVDSLCLQNLHKRIASILQYNLWYTILHGRPLVCLDMHVFGVHKLQIMNYSCTACKNRAQARWQWETRGVWEEGRDCWAVLTWFALVGTASIWGICNSCCSYTMPHCWVGR